MICSIKMNTAQVTAYQSGICVKNISQLHVRSRLNVLPKNINPCCRVWVSLRAEQSFGLTCQPASQSQKPLHICLAGGKGMMGNNDENSPWKSIEKAMEKFKGQSIEDVLRKQIEKDEYYDNGGSGVKPPGGGGDSGSGGGPDGSDGSEDESFSENLQVYLATFGFIFLYIYILNGAEITKIARDYIKYLFGGSQSVRLRNAMYLWGALYHSLTAKEVEEDEYWLEKAILDTATCWYNPADYREALRNYLEANPDEVDAIREVFELDSDEDVMDYLQSESDSESDEDEISEL